MEANLYHEERKDITIDVTARFEDDMLIIDGCDTGKKVQEYWGDWDYEYVLRVHPPGIDGLCDHFGVPRRDHERLLKALQANYNGNKCFSELSELFGRLKLPSDGYSWT